MKAIIEIRLDTAVFGVNERGNELARILRKAADMVDRGVEGLAAPFGGKLRDRLGNTVGKIRIDI